MSTSLPRLQRGMENPVRAPPPCNDSVLTKPHTLAGFLHLNDCDSSKEAQGHAQASTQEASARKQT